MSHQDQSRPDQGKTPKGQWRKILAKVAMVLFTLFGTSAFACFICEEAMQMTSFGAFAYQSAKDWHGLELHLQTMKVVYRSSETITRGIGWLNPIMYPAYLNYLEAQRSYIEGIENRVQIELANEEPQETTFNGGASQEVPPNGDCVWKLIHWTDKETGEAKSAWYCPQTDKWYWP
jgi:hypothetical protein